MPPTVEVRKQEHFARLRQQGWSRKAAALEAKVSESWAYNFEHGHHNNGDEYKASQRERKMPPPKERDRLCAEASRALKDFEYFRRRYLGHISTPWQVEVGEQAVQLLESLNKEYVDLNAPPGVGKSTLIVDLGCWVTVQNRSIRGLIGSKVASNARRQVLRIRRELERTTPSKAKSELIDLGLACDAEATLAGDYGMFKPIAHADLWRAEEFIVAQLDDVPITEKEPTWSSYGQDSGVLSNRFDLIFWDDLVTNTNTRTFEVQKNLEVIWDDELETRLEPGGLLMLAGQRLAATDLYHYVKKKVVPPDEEEDNDDDDREPLYKQMIYPAHDEEKCTGTHKKLQPWPEGCLLDPFRLTWRELVGIKENKPQKFAIVYQQGDGDQTTQFIRDEWLEGGVDAEDGSIRSGCYDLDRQLCELPKGLVGPHISIATVDPSGDRNIAAKAGLWALQWWIYTPEADNRMWLMDLENRKLGANELLDFDATSGEHTGWMEDWQIRSAKLGHPIKLWVVEANAAHGYLLAYNHLRTWIRNRGVDVRPHKTARNKLDEDLGPTMMRDHFKFGRVRLPYAQGQMSTRIQTLKFVDQLKSYGNSPTYDQVMAAWFAFAHRDSLVTPVAKQPPAKRPSWLRRHAA